MIQYDKILTRSEFADSTFWEIPQHAVFFDIETCGLSPESAGIYCIGCGFVNHAADRAKEDTAPFFSIRLFFAQTPAEEGEILTAAAELLSHFDTLITFNGTTFDLPFVRKRMGHAGSAADSPNGSGGKHTGSGKEKTDRPKHAAAEKAKDQPAAEYRVGEQSRGHTDPFSHMRHIDLYREIRRMKNLLGLSSCRQKACEEFLSIGRDDKYSGGELIWVYHSYVRRPDPHSLHLLLLHNCEDVKGMADLCTLLSYRRALRGEFEVESCAREKAGFSPAAAARSCTGPEEAGGAAFLKVVLACPAAFPREISGSKPCLRTDSPAGAINPPEVPARRSPAVYRFSGTRLTLWFPLFHGTLKYFFPDPENYYYLPQEDMAVHKSVGAFVDPAYRVRAGKKNCYTKKECDYICIPEGKKKGNSPCRSLRLEYADGLCCLCIPPWIAEKTEAASVSDGTADTPKNLTGKAGASQNPDSSTEEEPEMTRFFGELKEWLTTGLEHWLLSS